MSLLAVCQVRDSFLQILEQLEPEDWVQVKRTCRATRHFFVSHSQYVLPKVTFSPENQTSFYYVNVLFKLRQKWDLRHFFSDPTMRTKVLDSFQHPDFADIDKAKSYTLIATVLQPPEVMPLFEEAKQIALKIKNNELFCMLAEEMAPFDPEQAQEILQHEKEWPSRRPVYYNRALSLASIAARVPTLTDQAWQCLEKAPKTIKSHVRKRFVQII